MHNTYFTLPVLIAMLSNHYGFLYGAQHNWLVLVLVMLAGALIRHSFVARHKALVAGKRVPWEICGRGHRADQGLGLWLALRRRPQAPARARQLRAQVRAVIAAALRDVPQRAGGQQGVQLHAPELIAKNAQALYQQAVVLKAMPLNNATQITDEERSLLGRWYEAGAATR